MQVNLPKLSVTIIMSQLKQQIWQANLPRRPNLNGLIVVKLNPGLKYRGYAYF